jgi:hypothetical protein
MCFRAKSDAVKVFADHNQHVLEPWGGLHEKDSTGATFDAVNERYGLVGRHKVFSYAEALWVATPKSGAGYCLDQIDVKALNDTPPARRAGGFRLPPWAESMRAERAWKTHYSQVSGPAREPGCAMTAIATLLAVFGVGILAIPTLAIAARRSAT